MSWFSRYKIRTFLFAIIAVGALWGLWRGATSVNQTLTRTVNDYLRQALPGVATVGRVTALPWRIALQHVRWNVGDLSMEPVLEAHRIIVRPSLSAMLIGRLVLSRVTVRDVTVTIVRAAKGSWNFTTAMPPAAAAPPHAAAILQHLISEGKLLVRRLEVMRGTIHFQDRAEGQPIEMHVENLRLMIEAHPMPQHLWAARVFAEGQLRVRSDGRESPFRITGWFDPVAKDVEAKFQVNDVELGPLEPYYQGRITKVRAYEGRLTLQGTADALANHLTIKCQATFSHLTQGDISVLGRTIADVGGALNGAQGTLATEFTIHGPLDNPAQWTYQLGPNQAPLILLFLPFMKQNGETTVINIGPAQIDVGQAVQHWLGSNAPTPATGTTMNESTGATLTAPASQGTPPPPPATTKPPEPSSATSAPAAGVPEASPTPQP